MRLSKLTIEGFRKHYHTEISFSDSTFLIGENNVGKSSVLCALDYLLNNKTKIPEIEYYSITNHEGVRQRVCNEIIFTAEFRDLPIEAQTWRGFKGRLLKYSPAEGESGLKFVYRKTFSDKGVVIETLENEKEIKPIYNDCESLHDYFENGLCKDNLPESLQNCDETKKLSAKEKRILLDCDDLYDYQENTEHWFTNPGGIPQNVLSKLPKYLLIPAQDKQDEITGSSGTLQNTLKELFDEIKESSENYKKAREYLSNLEKELDPTDSTTEISKMIAELNDIVAEIFPDSSVAATSNLSDADNVIKPIFNIEMSSNIATPANLQGTGLIRSTVFALLRYKCIRDSKKQSLEARPLIIGFEEPELYLHPNAIAKMRDIIYCLAETRNNQIVCTTHSPFMIDISKRPAQILNNLWLSTDKKICDGECSQIVNVMPFNVTKEFLSLQQDDRQYIKMILKVDEDVANSFFVKNVLIVEGDTEKIVIKETINLLPEKLKSQILSDWHIVRARGKAAIIPLVKYLKAMSINVYVMHDEDSETPGAVIFNQPIKDALNNDERLAVLHNDIEDVIGYPSPNADKPFKAYKYVCDNWNNWNDVSKEWKKCIEKIFCGGNTVVVK